VLEAVQYHCRAMRAAQRPIVEIKVTLRGSRPPIWRRLHVPGDVSLFRLHEVLQVAMGWYNCHLHLFSRNGVEYGSPDPEFGAERVSERATRLQDVLRRPKERLRYEYDFGDGWEHEVVLERILEPEPSVQYPSCVTGKRACPPEDCGGIGGFYHYLSALADPKEPDHEEMVEWRGPAFDASAFNSSEVNSLLHPEKRSRRGPA
jgi:Plasmid pRiA4b ORF-3-like protein